MAAVSLCCPRMATGVHRILRNADRNIYRSRLLLSTSTQNRNEAMPLPTHDKVADLNALLKQRLNISDAPVMMAGAAAPAAAATPKEEEEEEVAAPAAVQTNFAVKIKTYDAAKKVGLIKAVKGVMEGMNLVQAKKFVESCPAILKEDLGKDEAEKMKEALVAAGAEVDIE